VITETFKISMFRLPLIVAVFVAAWPFLLYVAKHKALKIILVVVGVIIALPLVVFSVQWADELYMMSRARGLAAQIENYRLSHGSYPVSLLDVGSNDVNGPIYYERNLESPDAYHLWFGTGFGTTACYSSRTGTWNGCYVTKEAAL
jgi:type II secretory pathway pseudopilin PulG